MSKIGKHNPSVLVETIYSPYLQRRCLHSHSFSRTCRRSHHRPKPARRSHSNFRENQQGDGMAHRLRLQGAQRKMGLGRATNTRTTCANSYCRTAAKRATGTATAAANAASSCGPTTASPPPPEYAAATSAAEHAAPARLRVQLPEYGAEHVFTCCAAHTPSSKHTSRFTTPTTFTISTTAAAIRRRRKTEQKDSLRHLKSNVRQSRLQPAAASLPRCLCRTKFWVWASSGRSLVELAGPKGKSFSGFQRYFVCFGCRPQKKSRGFRM